MINHKLMILGRSGSGKTTSMRNLDPVTTGVINCDREVFPFPMDGYNTVMENGKDIPDLSKSNYVVTGKPASVVATMLEWDARDDIKLIVLDTLTHLYTDFYIKQCIGQDFGGYKDMGTSFHAMVDTIQKLKTNVVVFGHIEYIFNEMGDRTIKMKSHGNMIESFEPESYFNILLSAEVINEDGELRWVFRTQPETVAEKWKAPKRFGKDGEVISSLEKYEDNDLNTVLNKLDEFYNSN